MTTSNQSTESHSSSTGHALASSEWLDSHFLAMQPDDLFCLRV